MKGYYTATVKSLKAFKRDTLMYFDGIYYMVVLDQDILSLGNIKYTENDLIDLIFSHE